VEEGIGVPGIAYEEAKGRYNVTTGESTEQSTLSSREEGTAEDKVGDDEAAIADSGVHEGVRTRRSGTLCGEASGIEACANGDEVAVRDGRQAEQSTNLLLNGGEV
jgi:hypothetical protein